MKKVLYIFSAYLAVFLLVQLICGAFPVEVFGFPVNAAVLFAATAGLWVLHREKPDGGVSSLLASGKTSIVLIAAMLAVSLVLGFVPQLPDAEYMNRAAGGYDPGFLGVHDVIHSWWFIAIAVAFMANLLMVIFSHSAKPRFLLNHVGVLFALAGGFFGSADMSVSRAMVYRDSASNQAFTKDGRPETLGFEMELQDFEEETDSNRAVQNYTASVRIEDRTVDIRVNHPYHRNAFEDVYLVGYDREVSPARYCILEIVRQPWKYMIWLGVVMMIAGSILLYAQGVRIGEEKK